ncbi:MAG: hypothetical protein EB127_13300 [Alphaproteobacteria bacterium]|nr:hypothetical protein [Alphaproteobacteria bacterium]
MSKEIDIEKWLAYLFSELIRRGIECDEHLHCKDSLIGDLPPPNLQQLRIVHTGWVGEFLTPLLKEHLDKIVEDYQKLEDKP